MHHILTFFPAGCFRKFSPPFPGNISSPVGDGGKYPNGVECVWEFNARPGFHATLQFYDRFDVEAVAQCANDYLEVSCLYCPSCLCMLICCFSQVADYRQEAGRFTRLGQRLCGREVPPPVTTNSERARLLFRSNGQVNGDGFKVGEKSPVRLNTICRRLLCTYGRMYQIRWLMECGGVYNDTSSLTGEFSSPGYPEVYGNSLKCNYTVVASPQDFVALTFVEPFELERSEDCPTYVCLCTVQLQKQQRVFQVPLVDGTTSR